MIFSVSTIKDSKANIDFFINENIRSGIDHMFIFYEGDLLVDPSEYKQATFISSLQYNRSINNLNTRQEMNIRRVVEFLHKDYEDHWIVNLDGDEVVNFDKKILANLDKKIQVITLYPIEPIVDGKTSIHDQSLCKTTLSKGKLETAKLFDLIDKESNREWLRGHILGKYMARIRLDRKYKIHRVLGGPAEEALTNRDFNIIHYESASFDEFIRKFKNHTGNKASFNNVRAKIVTFFKEYADDPEFLNLATVIYDRLFVEKDINLKVKLGLLFELNRIDNPSQRLDDMHLEDDALKSTLILNGRYANILRSCAVSLEKAGELEDAYTVYKLAQCSRPYGEFINKKVENLKVNKKRLEGRPTYHTGDLQFSEKQKKAIASVKSRVDQIDIPALSDSIKGIVQRYC